MIGLVFRLLLAVCVAVLAVLAVVDATRSIGASELVLTTLGESLDLIVPRWESTAADWFASVAGPDDGPAIMRSVAGWPATVTVAVAGVVFAYLGRPRRPRRRLPWHHGSVSPSRTRR